MKNANTRERAREKQAKLPNKCIVNGRYRSAKVFTAPSLTKQAHKEEADINSILKKYTVTGTVPINQRPATYMDISNIKSYEESFNIVEQAKESYMSLPIEVRKKFKNPLEFINFVQNPQNEKALIEMGLTNKKENPADQANLVDSKDSKKEIPVTK